MDVFDLYRNRRMSADDAHIQDRSLRMWIAVGDLLMLVTCLAQVLRLGGTPLLVLVFIDVAYVGLRCVVLLASSGARARGNRLTLDPVDRGS